MPSSRYVTGGSSSASHDSMTPADEAQEPRYRIYVLCPCQLCNGNGKDGGLRCPECRGEGRERRRVAECETEQALGVALVTLGREGEFEECPVGVLDTQGEVGKKWLISPWLPSARNVADAGRTLGQRSAQARRERA